MRFETIVGNSDTPEAALSRSATEQAGNANFADAVTSLRAAFKGDWQDIRNRCRVARFLQQDGRYEECIEEFAVIFNEIDPILTRQFAHQSKRVRLGLACHNYSELCDQARISCNRQGDSLRVANFATLTRRWRAHAFRVQGRDESQLLTRREEEARSLALYPTDEDAIVGARELAEATEATLRGCLT